MSKLWEVVHVPPMVGSDVGGGPIVESRFGFFTSEMSQSSTAPGVPSPPASHASWLIPRRVPSSLVVA
ncbi:hypothetical protein [Halorussus caseinilyticus]|uniref:Uncharacterized protein n=1 Tax=Halorussus caseinilyticus TaxID=3034025 RepID=A0ABD5WLR3_9EURY